MDPKTHSVEHLRGVLLNTGERVKEQTDAEAF